MQLIGTNFVPADWSVSVEDLTSWFRRLFGNIFSGNNALSGFVKSYTKASKDLWILYSDLSRSTPFYHIRPIFLLAWTHLCGTY